MRFNPDLLGSNITRRRLQLGLTQADIADQLIVTQSTVGNWERGTCSPVLHRLYRLAEVLHTTVGELLGEEAPSNGHRLEVA